MASTAAVLNILVTANTKQANAALAKTQAQLGATAATANKSAAGMGASIAKGAKVGGLAIAALGAMSIKAAADWEDAFAGVRKTVNATEGEFNKMEKGLRGLAKTMPITATEVADLAAEAGALGIKAKDIVKFTKVAAMLGEATDMSANDAANGLARLSNVMGTSSKDFERLGSTLVALGNKGASTEAEILSMAQRMAGAAKIIGLTEAEVLSMSSALASVGIRAEMGGSAISRVWLQIDDAIAKGSGQLKSFAEIAGMTEKQFTRLFDQNANKAVVEYAAGLKRAHDEGESVSEMLKAVDLNEIRVRETLLKSSAAHDLLTKAQEQGNRAWEKNNALNQEAQTRFKTVASQATILKNRITDLFISLGQKLEPATRAVLETFNRLAAGKLPKWFQDIIDKSAPLRAAIGAVGSMFEKVFGGIENILGGMVRAIKGAFDVIAGILTGDWARAWEGVKEVARGAVEGVIGIVKAITAPVRAVAGIVLKVFKGAFNAIKGAATGMLDAALGAVTMVLDGVAKGADLMSKLPGPIGDAWDKIQTAAEDAADSINRTRERIRGANNEISKSAKGTGQTVSAVMGGISRDTQKHMQAAANSGKKHSGDLRRGVVQNTKNMADGVAGGLQNVVNNTNKALKGFGVKKSTYVAFEAERANLPQGNQTGGVIVPGRGSGDTVPAMLEPGEVVLNRRAVAAMGGAQKANRINKRIPRFAGGGLVQALGPYDIPPIQYDANHAGGNSHLHLSMQSVAAAQALAARIRPMGWTASESPWAGGVTVQHQDPGHYSGSAFDANTAADETRAEVAAVARVLKGGAVGGALGAAAVKIADMVLRGPAGPLRDMGQKGLDKAVAGANSMVARLAPVDDGNQALLSGDGDVERVFAKVAKRISTSKAATMALGMAGYHESGMQDLSYGDSSSQGALQLLASTAAGLGISPHDEGAIASHFLLRGYWGKGGANSLAAQGYPPHVIAHYVQGNATGTSVYAAERPRATAWMKKYGLKAGGIVQKLAGGGTARRGGGGGNTQVSVGGASTPGPSISISEAHSHPVFKRIQEIADFLIRFEDEVAVMERMHGWASSEMGTDLSAAEIAAQTGGYEQILGSLHEYADALRKGMRKSRSGTELWTHFKDELALVEGPPVADSRIFSTMEKLDELRNTVPGTAATDNSELLALYAQIAATAVQRQALAEQQVGLLGGMPNYAAAGGIMSASPTPASVNPGVPAAWSAPPSVNANVGIERLTIHENGRATAKIDGRELEVAVERINRRNSRNIGRTPGVPRF
jgi:TP901 family phage tail tape measure protein